MTTIKEDYVSFETAKLLKEKGFDGYCWSWYHNGNHTYTGTSRFCNSELKKYEYSKPTQQMVMYWLREVHNIHIEIYVIKNYDKKICEYTYTIMDLNFPGSDDGIDCCNKYKTYEEACEAAIKYYLENFILK